MVSSAHPGSPCSSYLPCYFTYNPPVYDHFSVETPSAASPIYTPSPSSQQPDCDPSHPLLSYRPTPPQQQQRATNMASSDLMRMQSNAAHASPIRPRPVPQQNLLQVTSDDSTTSSNSSNRSSSTSSSNSGCSSRTSLDMFSSPEAARCSRCQSTSSVDLRTGKSNMVQYGLNLWYCSRCAGMVGLVQR
jgi:hypothetical protein